jgi:hypothetical protein
VSLEKLLGQDLDRLLIRVPPGHAHDSGGVENVHAPVHELRVNQILNGIANHHRFIQLQIAREDLCWNIK